MQILPHHLATTKDLLTSRAGLACVGQVMQSIGFSALVDRYFPQPKSNRGFKASAFVNSMVMMLHEGGQCLDDIRHIRDDEALRVILGMEDVPQATALGNWLRRVKDKGLDAVSEVNKAVLTCALHTIKTVTLDIDATFSESKTQSAKWGYMKRKGYMPMVGHIAETGQVAATQFRAGNVTPSTDNLEFIHQCEQALPEGVSLAAVRIDAAGYQKEIVDECVERKLKFAIRVKMSHGLKNQIQEIPEDQWRPLLNKEEEPIQGASTLRISHMMQKGKHPFTVIVQRCSVEGQQELDLGVEGEPESIRAGKYMYRAIAVSRVHPLSNSEWVHWYNQRGEHSENRIKELKNDFAADRMPCQDFKANALYFALCALSYNLFALMRMHLPPAFEAARAKTIRWRLFAMAGKVVRHGRKLILKLRDTHSTILRDILIRLQRITAPPNPT